MVSFATADFIVLGGILASIIALGFSAKLRESNTLQLIAAGRQLTLPLFVATLVTTWYGGILGVGEFFYKYGLSTIFTIAAPYYVFAVIYALWIAKRIRREPQISLPERMARYYGRPTAILAASLLVILGAPSAHIFMMGTLISLTTGWSITAAVGIGAIVGTLFLYRGGLLADARANLICFAMMYFSFILILIIAIATIGSPSHVIGSLPSLHKSWDGGQGALYVVSWFILGAWTFVDPGFHQRVTAASTEANARKGVLISVGFWMLFDLLSISTALYAFVGLQGTEAAKVIAREGQGVMVYPLFGNAILPEGFKGIFFAGMAGVILSAMVGYTLVTGSTLGRDLVGRIIPNLSETSLVLWTRIGIAVATLMGVGLALSIQSVVEIWFNIGGIVVPGLLIPCLVSYVAPQKLTPGLAFACMTLGAGSSAIWYFFEEVRWPQPVAHLHHIYPGVIIALTIWGIGLWLHKIRSADNHA